MVPLYLWFLYTVEYVWDCDLDDIHNHRTRLKIQIYNNSFSEICKVTVTMLLIIKCASRKSECEVFEFPTHLLEKLRIYLFYLSARGANPPNTLLYRLKMSENCQFWKLLRGRESECIKIDIIVFSGIYIPGSLVYLVAYLGRGHWGHVPDPDPGKTKNADHGPTTRRLDQRWL